MLLRNLQVVFKWLIIIAHSISRDDSSVRANFTGRGISISIPSVYGANIIESVYDGTQYS